MITNSRLYLKVVTIQFVVLVESLYVLLGDLRLELCVLLRVSLEVAGGVGGVPAVLDPQAADLAVDEGWSLGEPFPDLGRIARVSHHLIFLTDEAALCKYLVLQLLRLGLDI